MSAYRSKANITRQPRRLAVLFAGAILVSGCSTLATSEERSADSTAPPALAMVDENGVVRLLDEVTEPTLGIEATLEQVIGAISALDAPQPTTMRLEIEGSIDAMPYRTVETVTSSPSHPVVAVSVDHTEYGTLLLEQLSRSHDDGTTTAPTEEVLSMAAAATVPASYLIDGETRWLKYSAREALDAARTPAEERTHTDGPHTELWLAEPMAGGEQLTPAGLGADVSPDLALELLSTAGFDGTTPPAGLTITEQTTTSDRVVVTLGVNGDPAVIVELDADLVLTAVESLVSDSAVASGEERLRLEIEWQADTELLAVPSEDQRFEQN